MFGSPGPVSPLDSIAHVIQVALTPVFLLSGLATLLSVFSTRLGRVADQVNRLAAEIEACDEADAARLAVRLTRLQRRSRALDAAVILGALGGVLTCGATLVLFLGALRDAAVAGLLFTLFGAAVICAMGALGTFLYEMLLASHGVRAQAAHSRKVASR